MEPRGVFRYLPLLVLSQVSQFFRLILCPLTSLSIVNFSCLRHGLRDARAGRSSL